jgi:Fic family protein
MEPNDFESAHGKIELVKDINGSYYPSFIPNNLPPKIAFDEHLVLSLSKADSMLGKLSGSGLFLLNPDLLIMPYLKKEAVMSSRIEGTKISLSELLLYETKDDVKETPDALEVTNYVKAVKYALQKIEKDPIDIELIKEMHRILMQGVRGGDRSPGEFRTVQNWIGSETSKKEDASFIPPYPEKVPELMEDLAGYINSADTTPELIKCALIHYQFETIHPFRDGNGRIGRALITLYLCKQKKMIKPLLYLSAFLEKHRDLYANLLLQTNQKGNFQRYLSFFLAAVETQSEDALDKTTKLQKLREDYRKRIQKEKTDAKMLELIDGIFTNPYITVNQAKEVLKKTYPTAKKTICELVDAGILKEKTTQHRNKIYEAAEILKILES